METRANRRGREGRGTGGAVEICPEGNPGTGKVGTLKGWPSDPLGWDNWGILPKNSVEVGVQGRSARIWFV